MVFYFALWIPVLKKGELKIINQELDDIILKDLPDAPDLQIKGCIDKNTYNITFEYCVQNKDKHTYTFEHVERNNTGFAIYRINVDDNATDFVSVSFRNGLHKSFYHYIKGFFHSHIHHDEIEDSLLTCYFSQDIITLNDKQTFKCIVNFYIDCYIQKLTGNVSEIQNHLHEVLEEMSQGKNVTKNIKFMHELIKNCYCVKGELGYCRFLSDRTVNASSYKKRQELAVAYKNFESSMDELLFWYNHYLSLVSYTEGGKSLKWGIAGTMIGILSLTVTAVLECRNSRQLTNEEQLKQIERLDVFNKIRIAHIDDKIDSLFIIIKQKEATVPTAK